jgi:hypothetical protein
MSQGVYLRCYRLLYHGRGVKPARRAPSAVADLVRHHARRCSAKYRIRIEAHSVGRSPRGITQVGGGNGLRRDGTHQASRPAGILDECPDPSRIQKTSADETGISAARSKRGAEKIVG